MMSQRPELTLPTDESAEKLRKAARRQKTNKPAKKKQRSFSEMMAEYVRLRHERAIMANLASYLSQFIHTELGQVKEMRCNDSNIAPVVSKETLIDVRDSLRARVDELTRAIEDFDKGRR